MTKPSDGGGTDEHFDAGVLGLGPAGVAAASELVRYKRSVVALELDRVGGLIHLARCVENFPGAPRCVPGGKVAEVLKEQLARFPPEVVRERVARVEFVGDGFELRPREDCYHVRTLVVATGTRARQLGVVGEHLPWVKGSWDEMVMPLDGGRAAVIGGGDLAADQALSLHDDGAEVEILVRSGGLRCHEALLDEVAEAPDIKVHHNCFIDRFDEGRGRKVIYAVQGREVVLPVDAALVSIGREPEMPLLQGSPMTLERAAEHEADGLFLAGDVHQGRRRQAAIAFGAGLDAAMRAEEHLRSVLR